MDHDTSRPQRTAGTGTVVISSPATTTHPTAVTGTERSRVATIIWPGASTRRSTATTRARARAATGR